MTAIKVIDLFAGPGGLGEGFSAFRDTAGKQRFKIALSIELEASAHRTLTLRSLFRQYPAANAPEAYYAFMRGELGAFPEDELYQLPELQDALELACLEAGQYELGKQGQHARVYKAIRNALGRNECILLGGPPCQAYSLVGRARNQGEKGSQYSADSDHRNFLYLEYLRIIARFQPMIFVMENVKGLLSAKTSAGPVFPRIMTDLSDPGKSCSTKPDPGRQRHKYRIFSFVTPHPDDLFGDSLTQLEPRDYVIKSEQYGIPQCRHRVILLGVREDLVGTNPLPLLTPSAKQVSVKDAIGDLPPLRSSISREEDTIDQWLGIRHRAPSLLTSQGHILADPLKHFLAGLDEPAEHTSIGSEFSKWSAPRDRGILGHWYSDPKLDGYITNHATRGHIRGDLERYWFVAAYRAAMGYSPKSDNFPKTLRPNHANFTSGKFADRFRAQGWGLPSTTITSHISKDGHYYIHPDPAQMRSLTVREAARLQTFPDNYHFVGSRTEQYVQVGNAVPPLLARQLASLVNDYLCR
ncbi:DNA cytosine methyltransferase [Luminiphilus sp.]|nr:DNA cytosine methyltransferase [Luminiphilus sp.]